MQNAGFICIQDGDGGTGRRKIYAGINPLADNHDKNVMVPENHDKNATVTMTELSPPNKVINKKENKEPPISPKAKKGPMPAELIARVEHYAGEDLQLRDALLEFARMRAARKKPIETDRQITLLLSKLNELSKGRRRDKIALIEKATVNGWLSFYPLHEDDLPAASPGDRSVDAPAEVARW